MANADDEWKVRLLVAGQSDTALTEESQKREAAEVSLGPGPKKLFTDFFTEVLDVTFFTLVFFRGKEVFLEDPDGVGDIDPKLKELAVGWLRRPPHHGAALPFAVPAVVLVACLERFMVRVAPLAAKLSLAAAKTAYKSHVKQRKRNGQGPLSETDFALTKLQPSAARAGAAWFLQLDRFLGVKPSVTVQNTIGSLIDFRNGFVHSNREAVEALKVVQGGLVPAWMMALRGERSATPCCRATYAVRAAKWPRSRPQGE